MRQQCEGALEVGWVDHGWLVAATTVAGGSR
jgi:hypothetical protein